MRPIVPARGFIPWLSRGGTLREVGGTEVSTEHRGASEGGGNGLTTGAGVEADGVQSIVCESSGLTASLGSLA